MRRLVGKVGLVAGAGRGIGRAVQIGRLGRPDDLTGMAVFLPSSESDYVVARTYNVDGGNWMS